MADFPLIVLRKWWTDLDTATAALAQPDAGEGPHEHEFREYTICRHCRRTEADVAGECHHCDEQLGQCWHCLRGGATPEDTPPPSPQPSLTREDYVDLENACRHLSEKFAGTTGEKPWRDLAAKCRAHAEPETGR